MNNQSFTVGRTQSGPLTALIGYLNVLLKYFNFSNFYWQGTTNIRVGLSPAWPALDYTPVMARDACRKVKLPERSCKYFSTTETLNFILNRL